MEFDSFRWCNVGGPVIWCTCSNLKRIRIKLWNAFNRETLDDHYWGYGLLQIGSRHLFFVGHSGVSILFIGETK